MALMAVAGAFPGGSARPAWGEGVPSGERAYRFAIAAFCAAAGVFVLIFRSFLLAGDRAAQELSDSVRRHLPEVPESIGFPAAASAASDLLRLYEGEKENRGNAAAARTGGYVEKLTEAHRDLLTHHRFTKRMLQSLRADEVLATLAQGVRDGLGFAGAVVGIRDAEGGLLFRPEAEGDGRGPVRIHCWDEESLIARTLWEGDPLLVRSVGEHRHSEADRAVLGEGRAFLAPLFRKSSRRCSAVKSCGDTSCAAHDRDGVRCWIEGRGRLVAGDPPAVLRQRQECARCDLFRVSAIVVARETPDSRRIGPETTGSIATLASEAALALEVAELYENTRVMSVTDGLTGLANYREFYLSLGKELERARRYSHTVSLLMVDVDDFKRFNDHHGHVAGDRALRTVADLLRKCVRGSDIVARYGGEEFAVILPESTPAGALMLAERIKTEVAVHRFADAAPGQGHLTVSIGIYSSEKGTDSVEQTVGFADEAVYSAKNSGKNQVVVKAYA